MTNRVDILFKMEEMLPNCTFAKSEKRLRHIETNSTTFGRLKEMARFQLSIRGDLELWLVYEDGYASPMNLGLMEPISKLITKDSTLQVEKLDGHDNQGLLYPSEQTYLPSGSGPSFASLPRLPSNTDDSKGSELDDEEFARLLSMEPKDMNSNRHKHRAFKMLGQNASPPHPGEIIARASCSQFAIEGGQSACTSICLYAASQLLERINETPSCITTDILDVYLQYGSMIFRNLNLQRGDHTSVDDLWNHLLYSEIVPAAPTGGCDFWDHVSLVLSRMPRCGTKLCSLARKTIGRSGCNQAPRDHFAGLQGSESLCSVVSI